jgi:hypothetical protein
MTYTKKMNKNGKFAWENKLVVKRGVIVGGLYTNTITKTERDKTKIQQKRKRFLSQFKKGILGSWEFKRNSSFIKNGILNFFSPILISGLNDSTIL